MVNSIQVCTWKYITCSPNLKSNIQVKNQELQTYYKNKNLVENLIHKKQINQNKYETGDIPDDDMNPTKKWKKILSAVLVRCYWKIVSWKELKNVKCSTCPLQVDEKTTGLSDIYTSEYLHSLNFNGVPPHFLKLKIGCPIILLRNINQSIGLCNGITLIVKVLHEKY